MKFDKIYCGELDIIFGMNSWSSDPTPKFIDCVQEDNFNALVDELRHGKKILFVTWKSQKTWLCKMLGYIEKTYGIKTNGLVGFKGNSYSDVHDRYINALCPNNWVRTYRLQNKIISFDGTTRTEHVIEK